MTNPFPPKGAIRKFAGKIYHYAGRTIYPSKARLVAQEMKQSGIDTKITTSRGAGSLLWTSVRTYPDLSEPFYFRNPIKEWHKRRQVELARILGTELKGKGNTREYQTILSRWAEQGYSLYPKQYKPRNPILSGSREKVVARRGKYKILEIIDFRNRRWFYLMTTGGVLLRRGTTFAQMREALTQRVIEDKFA